MSPAPLPEETIIACLTPAGKGAIATLGLWGPRAWELVRELFRFRAGSPRQLPAADDTGRIWLGRLGEGSSDEVVVTLKGIVPVAWVEIHCHGGREVIRFLLETFSERGLRACSWQEFCERTSGNRLRSQALAALADAITTRTAAILLDQYHGAFTRAVEHILASWQRGDEPRARGLLQALAQHAHVGRHLTMPWRLVVAGAPNVGKSSLINALAGYQRCVVAPSPGTTRDLVTTSIAVAGWPIELTDTAGLRPTVESLEQQGVGLAQQAVRTADLCLWVLDASAGPVWPDCPTQTMHFVISKVDLDAAWDLDQAKNAVRVSALAGSGLAELCDAISRWLVPDPPPPGAAVPFTPQIAAHVEEAWRCQAAGQVERAKQVLANVAT
jgi:tRNA modification GTPase